LSFFGSWFTFAVFWYLIAYINGDLTSQETLKNESVISTNISLLINKQNESSILHAEKIETTEHEPCGNFVYV
jgi:hypothetical protein